MLLLRRQVRRVLPKKEIIEKGHMEKQSDVLDAVEKSNEAEIDLAAGEKNTEWVPRNV